MTKDLWKNLPRPIIGLSPMEGYSDSPFRRVCKLVNPTIVTFTEFTAADGLHHGAKKLIEKLYFHPDEQPVIAQIFGKDEKTFISATKLCEDLGFAGIDLNMGCPSKKVVKSEHGVALRKKPELAYRLIEAVAKNTKLPVSVKTRLGWSDASDLIDFGKGAENAGANMLCIHARTYLQPYKVPAQLEHVYEMKRHVSIPVLGNGGITSIPDGIAKLGNLDGFLIGQATFGNPWIFADQRPETFAEKMPVIKAHAQWMIDCKGEKVGSREIRKHLLAYVKGFDGAKERRCQLQQVTSMNEITSILDSLV